MSIETPPERADFIREIVAADVRSGRHATIVTRFPPEPNGYLHIGHAKSICLNFGIAREFGGRCHLRFDDTNPVKEEQEYIDAIEHDVRWLGFDWGEHLYHASDYFEQLYDWAVHLIRNGDAYVDDLSADEIREHRGTLTEPGRELAVARPSGRREPRPVRADARRRVPQRRARAAREDRHGLAQHQPARPGAVPDPPRDAPTHRRRVVHLPDLRLRARPVRRDRGRHPLDLHARVRGAPAALRLADRAPAGPLPAAAVRVRPAEPHLHGAVQALPAAARERGPRPRLGRPAHADDLRPCAGAASRRRVSATSRTMVGVAKSDSVIEIGQLEYAVRAVLNRTAPRRFGVLDPLKVVIENYPEGRIEEVEVPNNPEDPTAGTRTVPFSRELWIERDDFMEEPPPKFFRLAPGREVRLRAAYFVTCHEVVKDATGRVDRVALHLRPRRHAAAMRPTAAGRRRRCTGCRRRTPSRPRCACTTTSSRVPTRAPSDDLLADLNPNSETVLTGAFVEPSLAERRPGADGAVRAARLLRGRPDSRAGATRVQPDADAQGHLGQGPGARRLRSKADGR